MRRQLRLWWPKQLPPRGLRTPSSHILFGWFISSSSVSIDIAVALTIDEVSLSLSQSSLVDTLTQMDKDMPLNLREKSLFSVLGHYAVDDNDTITKVGKGGVKWTPSTFLAPDHQNNQQLSYESKGNGKCGCYGIIDPFRVAMHNNIWIKLANGSSGQSAKFWVPRVDHIHWEGQLMSQYDVHVILYEVPTYRSHHFSLSYLDFSKQAKIPLEKPMWVFDLQLRCPVVDLDTVLVALNSSAAAARYLKRDIWLKKRPVRFPIVWMFYAIMWHSLAIVIATLSTLFYVVLQSFHSCLSVGFLSWIQIIFTRVFNTSCVNIRKRSSQILYWPVFLLESGPRAHSCVEYAEKAALRKHSMWSNLAVDILLGNLIGLALLFYAESVFSWVLSFGTDVSYLLRTGCVWLMGVPAGFKLNTEVAAVLGTISLNVIQMWSSLLVFVSLFLNYIIKGMAVLGMVFGASILVALIKDLVMVTSLHLSILHRLTSLVYSLQTQALAALWRLFRGQKWNPLRVRLDSYDYSVEQHIVGSLLFSPLLLLLPTTSVFYIFFTIMYSPISLICVISEVIISVIHGTPYIKVFLRLVSPRRFPAGIWFGIASCKWKNIEPSEKFSPSKKNGGSYSKVQAERCKDGESAVVSFLYSNFPSIGEIVLPHYRELFSSGFRSLVVASSYGALTGKRVPWTFRTQLPSTIPWMAIPIKDYWLLCCKSVLSCMADSDHIKLMTH